MVVCVTASSIKIINMETENVKKSRSVADTCTGEQQERNWLRTPCEINTARRAQNKNSFQHSKNGIKQCYLPYIDNVYFFNRFNKQILMFECCYPCMFFCASFCSLRSSSVRSPLPLASCCCPSHASVNTVCRCHSSRLSSSPHSTRSVPASSCSTWGSEVFC